MTFVYTIKDIVGLTVICICLIGMLIIVLHYYAKEFWKKWFKKDKK